MPTPVEVTISRVAAGGAGVGREPSGRVVFVAGALPGERVAVEVVDERRRWARAELLAVLEASPDRREPPCPEVARGCGGCDLQHTWPEQQRALKVAVVADALARLARRREHPPIEVRALPEERYRTTVRCLVAGGRAGYRRRRSNEAVVVGSCLVAHPALEELVVDGRFGEAAEVTLRIGARTGERLALVVPSTVGVSLPGDVTVVSADELAAGRRAWFHEEVSGRRWRISASSFFQNRPDGADTLVAVVGEMLAGVPDGSRLVDLYAGVGLFAGTVGARHRVTAVERSASAVADARVNLAGLDARTVRADVGRWTPRPADAVVADPARSGLGARVVDRIVRTGAGDVVLVSCDSASFGRDVGVLADAGFELERVVLVDLFPQTSHVETVAHLRRRRPMP